MAVAHATFSFTSPSTRLKLHAQSWQPPHATPPAYVAVFLHGYGDYAGRYGALFQRVASSGGALFAFDAVSNGFSPPHPTRGKWNVSRFDDLVDDAERFCVETLAGIPKGTPSFLLGLSLGGLVASLVALRDQSRWTGLVRQLAHAVVLPLTKCRFLWQALLSACIDIEWTRLLRAQACFGRFLAHFLPNAPLVPAVRLIDRSRDREYLKRLAADERVPHRPVKCALAYEGLKAQRALQPRYRKFALPILALHGTDDKVTSMAAVQRLLAGAASTDKTMVQVRDAKHDLFHELEPEKEFATATLLQWMADHVNNALK